MLKEGDTVSFSVAPTIEIAKFTFLKASATVTRTLSDDVEGDLAEMQEALRHNYLRSLKLELGIMNEVAEVLEASGVDGLAEHVVKELHHGAQESHFKVEETTGGSVKAQAKGPTKKIGHKKAVAKKRPKKKTIAG